MLPVDRKNICQLHIPESGDEVKDDCKCDQRIIAAGPRIQKLAILAKGEFIVTRANGRIAGPMKSDLGDIVCVLKHSQNFGFGKMPKNRHVNAK